MFVAILFASVFASEFNAPETNQLAMPENPFIRGIYTADPSAHVWPDGRLWVYPSRDIAPPRGCDLMDKYHVFSTDNMVDWTDHGEILSSANVSWGRPEGGFMWAPDAAYKNNKYYFYFPHPTGSGSSWGSTWKIGCAISDYPDRGFKDMGFPMAGLGGEFMIDPAVFIDTDGKAYFYYGGGSRDDRCLGGELNQDMVTLASGMRQMQGVLDFHEGTWVFKRNEMYYLVYADNNPESSGGNQMRYCTSQFPLGPWTYRGVFLSPSGLDTAHGSVVEYKGEWFVFYHNKALSGMNVLRSCCVNKITFNTDGTIQMSYAAPSPKPQPEPAPVGAREYKTGDYCIPSGAALFESMGNGDVALAQLHMNQSYGTWNRIDGGVVGGKAELWIRYASNDDGAFIKVTVNNVEYDAFFAHSTGGWGNYNGYAHVNVDLLPGPTNTIVLEGGYFGANIAAILVKML